LIIKQPGPAHCAPGQINRKENRKMTTFISHNKTFELIGFTSNKGVGVKTLEIKKPDGGIINITPEFADDFLSHWHWQDAVRKIYQG